jgi:histidinol-phosphate aminotransferase
VYICNPNNPTGTLTPADAIDAWISEAPATTTFLVDEAYHEYADHPDYGSTLKWIDTRPNVIVVRTFSKIYGMAGMRLGYAVAHPTTVARLRAFVCRNNPNVLANAAALASLADDGLMARSVAVNDEAKVIAHTTLDELGLEYLPTQANFLMHRINGDLSTYIGHMREAGVRVGRAFPPMLEWNRVSFGLPDEMDRWASALKEMRRLGQV